MNIPNLPTDNLYKFISLTGVLLALVCFGLLEYRINHQVLLNTELGLGKEHLDYFKSDQQTLLEKADSIKTMIDEIEGQGTNKEKPTIETIDSYIESLKEEHKAYINKTMNFDERIMELRAKSEAADIYYDRTQRIKWILFVGGYVGIILAFIGFYFWYHRFQKYQDILIKHQVDNIAQQVAQADAEDRAA